MLPASCSPHCASANTPAGSYCSATKKFLAGELPAERLLVKPAAFYDHDMFDVRLGTRAQAVDRQAQRVQLDDGSHVRFDRLVFATGARVNRLACDGVDLDGIHYLRSIRDVERISAAHEAGQRVVIVGAGYIGLEVAAVLCESGSRVTVIDVADRVMSRVVARPVSEFFQALHAAHGVDIRLGHGVAGFTGSDRVAGVETDTGEQIPADLVVVGIGIRPNVELAEDAGLEIDDGIVVDAGCRTSAEHLYAIGDCTSHPNRIYDRRVRLESVQNALEQAKTAAINLCGEDAVYDEVPWFWSDQYDIKLQIAGLSTGYDETLIRGNPGDRSFACLYLADGRLIAADCVNQPRDFMQSKALIAAGARIDPAVLVDTSTSFRDMLAK